MQNTKDEPISEEMVAKNHSGLFHGQMRKVDWYLSALSNREIDELAKGKFHDVYFMSNCICPEGWPQIYPQDDRFCITNEVGSKDTVPELVNRIGKQAHPLGFAVDGDSSTYWVSASGIYLDGGFSLFLDFKNGVYDVFEIAIEFYGPFPKSIRLLKSISHKDEKFDDVQFYSRNCQSDYMMSPNKFFSSSKETTCIGLPNLTSAPTRNGTVLWSALRTASSTQRDKLSSGKYRSGPSFENFIKADKIQILMTSQYFTLDYGRDEVNLAHRHYSIREISVLGRCICNGHADDCDTEVRPHYKCKCSAESNTEGHQCERCKAMYNDKPYRSSNSTATYNCRKCNCNKHSDRCHYARRLDQFPDEHLRGSGGVCHNCQHHTTGRFCHKCQHAFYRNPSKPLDDPDACIPCKCNIDGVLKANMDCDQNTGHCYCKKHVTGHHCDQCKPNFINLALDNPEGCQPDCNTTTPVCNELFCEKCGFCDCSMAPQHHEDGMQSPSEMKDTHDHTRDYIIIGCIFGGLVLCLVIAKGIKKKLEMDNKKLVSNNFPISTYEKQTDDIYVVP